MARRARCCTRTAVASRWAASSALVFARTMPTGVPTTPPTRVSSTRARHHRAAVATHKLGHGDDTSGSGGESCVLPRFPGRLARGTDRLMDSPADLERRLRIKQRLVGVVGGVIDLGQVHQEFPGLEGLVDHLWEELRKPPPDEASGTEPQFGLLVTRQLGRYRLEEELGHGRQGRVFRAFDTRLRRAVALKVLTAYFASDARVRFEREAEITSSLRHPGICSVFDVGEHDGMPFIVMPIIVGESLASRLDRDWKAGGTDWCSVVGWIEAAAQALHAAHEASVVHRDVKPGNLMLTTDSQCVVMDFGLARSESLPAELQQTLSGNLVGSPAYMSPEQLRDDGEPVIDARSDVWALGVTLYEGVVGQRPFAGATLDALFRQIVQEEPTPVRRLRGNLPRDLETVVQTALQKAPSRRYQSAAELAGDLRRVLEHRPIAARRTGVIGRVVRWVRRNKAASLALSLGVGLAVGLPLTALTVSAFAAAHNAESQRKLTAQTSAELAAAAAEANLSQARLSARVGRFRSALDGYGRGLEAFARSAGRSRPDVEFELRLGQVEAYEALLEPGAASSVIRDIEGIPLSAQHRARLDLVHADLWVTPASARDLYQRALDSGALSGVDTLYARAMLATDVTKAAELLSECHRLDPLHRRSSGQLGPLLVVQGRWDDLESFAREMRAAYPEDPTGVLFHALARRLGHGEAFSPDLASELPGLRREALRLWIRMIDLAGSMQDAFREAARTAINDSARGGVSSGNWDAIKNALKASAIISTGVLVWRAVAAQQGKEFRIRIHPAMRPFVDQLVPLIMALARRDIHQTRRILNGPLVGVRLPFLDFFRVLADPYWTSNYRDNLQSRRILGELDRLRATPALMPIQYMSEVCLILAARARMVNNDHDDRNRDLILEIVRGWLRRGVEDDQFMGLVLKETLKLDPALFVSVACEWYRARPTSRNALMATADAALLSTAVEVPGIAHLLAALSLQTDDVSRDLRAALTLRLDMMRRQAKGPDAPGDVSVLTLCGRRDLDSLALEWPWRRLRLALRSMGAGPTGGMRRKVRFRVPVEEITSESLRGAGLVIVAVPLRDAERKLLAAHLRAGGRVLAMGDAAPSDFATIVGARAGRQVGPCTARGGHTPDDPILHGAYGAIAGNQPVPIGCSGSFASLGASGMLLLAAKSGDVESPVAARFRVGSGRLVVFGDEEMFGEPGGWSLFGRFGCWSDASPVLLRNSVAWLVGE